MARQSLITSTVLDRYRVTSDKFRLADHRPDDTGGLAVDKAAAKDALEAGTRRLSKLQERLYAQDRWAVLAIFQAMDAAGKDSAIKHVMSGVDPQGCEVHAFKAPSAEELDHDFMWRTTRLLPQRGRIGIFNRSYYEEVLVVRVHERILARQKLPSSLVTKDIWRERMEDIRHFESYLARNGTVVLKFFLHLSKEEQAQRFLDRLDDPDKRWKFSPDDVAERQHWDRYQEVYEAMIAGTTTPAAPWFVVPADRKWFTRLVVAEAMIAALEALDLSPPEPDATSDAAVAAARKVLLAERGLLQPERKTPTRSGSRGALKA